MVFFFLQQLAYFFISRQSLQIMLMVKHNLRSFNNCARSGSTDTYLVFLLKLSSSSGRLYCFCYSKTWLLLNRCYLFPDNFVISCAHLVHVIKQDCNYNKQEHNSSCYLQDLYFLEYSIIFSSLLYNMNNNLKSKQWVLIGYLHNYMYIYK